MTHSASLYESPALAATSGSGVEGVLGALREQAGFYARLLAAIEASDPTAASPDIRLDIFALDERILGRLESELRPQLASVHSEVRLNVELKPGMARAYYTTVRFQLFVRDRSGQELNLADGGFTDWTQKLLSNRKERLLVSGLGSARTLLLKGEPSASVGTG